MHGGRRTRCNRAGAAAGVRHLQHAIRLVVGQPRRWWERRQGREDFDFPGTWRITTAIKTRPDILHCHNLHGGWLRDGGYDIAALPSLSRMFPLVLTLHDAWLLSGHCAHSFDCERWKTGCGHCPDLTIYPAANRDATGYNWQRKASSPEAASMSRPPRWLMDKVDASMLKPACVGQRVIPNGVDLTIFTGADRREARSRLGLPQEAHILLFAANGVKQNMWKDYQTMRAALARVAEMMKEQPVLFIALGDIGKEESIGTARIQFVPHQDAPHSSLGTTRRRTSTCTPRRPIRFQVRSLKPPRAVCRSLPLRWAEFRTSHRWANGIPRSRRRRRGHGPTSRPAAQARRHSPIDGRRSTANGEGPLRYSPTSARLFGLV